ncbi:MAG: YceI family protein [Acidobacteriota bacterium]
MKRLMRTDAIVLALLMLLAVGCANPADDAPDAVVQEPAAEPEPAAAEAGEATTLKLAADSKIDFVGAKVTGTHDGGFQAFDGTVTLTDGTAEGSSVEVVIDATSVWSDDDRLTEHLKSADFFDVENFPTATFKSTEIAAAAEGGYTLTGNLELHGVTKQISFPANIEVGEGSFTAMAEFSINRKDFDIVYAGRPDDLIRDDVLIKLDLRSAGDAAAAPEGEGAGDETAGDGAAAEAEG